MHYSLIPWISTLYGFLNYCNDYNVKTLFTQSGDTVLHVAVGRSSLMTMEMMMGSHYSDRAGSKPSDIIKKLINGGADPNIVNKVYYNDHS